jgi:hypothetical protein
MTGFYDYEGKQGAQPRVYLTSGSGSYFERHGVERFPEFRNYMSQWGLLANCDGSAMRKGYGGYTLVYQNAKDGSWDALEYGVLKDRGIAMILGERTKPLTTK